MKSLFILKYSVESLTKKKSIDDKREFQVLPGKIYKSYLSVLFRKFFRNNKQVILVYNLLIINKRKIRASHQIIVNESKYVISVEIQNLCLRFVTLYCKWGSTDKFET